MQLLDRPITAKEIRTLNIPATATTYSYFESIYNEETKQYVDHYYLMANGTLVIAFTTPRLLELSHRKVARTIRKNKTV